MRIRHVAVSVSSLLMLFLIAMGASGQEANDKKLEPRDPHTGRIAGPPMEKWTPEQKKAYEILVPPELAKTRSPRGTVHFLLNHPDMDVAWIRYGETVRDKARFSRGVRELIIILSARRWNRDANWGHGRGAIEQGGISPEVVDKIKNGIRPTFEKDEQRVAYDFYNELTSNMAVSDKTYEEAWKTFGTDGLIDLTLLIGVYESSGMFGAAHRIEADTRSLPELLFQRGESQQGPVSK